MSLIIPSNSIRRKRQNLSYKPTKEMEDAKTFQYGKFNFDYAVNFEGLKISFEEKMGLCKYKRALKDWT
ncbi:MAG: hypothetical protein Q4Q53_06320, partial [Methanocorpusculum sp.]|nr:hypothetical protein [Methanocorpusculum sp.]